MIGWFEIIKVWVNRPPSAWKEFPSMPRTVLVVHFWVETLFFVPTNFEIKKNHFQFQKWNLLIVLKSQRDRRSVLKVQQNHRIVFKGQRHHRIVFKGRWHLWIVLKGRWHPESFSVVNGTSRSFSKFNDTSGLFSDVNGTSGSFSKFNGTSGKGCWVLTSKSFWVSSAPLCS